MPPLKTSANEATQRLNMEDAALPRQRRTAPVGQTPVHTSSGNPRRRKSKKNSILNQKSTIIAFSAVAAVLLVAIVITCIFLFAEPADDGLILNNVYAAGINIGGKTPEQAKEALQAATKDTYSRLDMVVSVDNSDLVLTPSRTGVSINIDAIVTAAYNYGRTGSRTERQNAQKQSLTKSHVISILPYLNLNTTYIQNEVDAIGSQYSSTLSQMSYRVEGTAPDFNMPQNSINPETVYQTLVINTGTAEYGLNTNHLYEQIMEAYNTNIFQVVGEIDKVAPDALDLQALFDELCQAPVNATLNETNYTVTSGKYGYGFKIEDVQAQINEAGYGKEIRIPMTFIRPDLTAEDLTDGLFEKELASFSTPATVDEALLANLRLVCKAIHNKIIHADESFSFNALVGAPTEAAGYQKVMAYVGKTAKEVVGGGISQVSSALYYCALNADLQILERHAHTYATTFIEPGLDADVLFGQKDLSFQNTTGRPIRIQAIISDAGSLKITILGTEQADYTVSVLYEEIRKFEPQILSHVMTSDNPGGYEEGDVLVKPITGYDIGTYRVYTYADGSKSPVKKLIGYSHYDKLDKVVVIIQDPVSESPDDSENTEMPEEDTNLPESE